MEKYDRVYARIDLEAIRKNVYELMGNVPEGTKALAVIKSDAYGHGAVDVARSIDDLVYGYAVATVDEGANLRRNGITKPVMVLGTVFDSEMERLLEYDIIPTIYDYETAQHLSQCAARYKKDVVCQLKVDTGMRRIGVEADENGVALAERMAALPYLKFQYVFTHFATADEMDKTFCKMQYDRFVKFIDDCGHKGIEFSCRHCANSAAIIDAPYMAMDMVRMGISLYGMYPSDVVNKRALMMYPAFELKSKVAYVKEVHQGEGISYGLTYKAQDTIKVATVPVGYGDGYPRMLSNKGYVLINGKKAPIVGRVCMDQFMVDVTNIPDVCKGTIVTLVGKDAGETISVEELSNLCGRFNYEFVCDITKRVPRVYCKGSEYVTSRDYFEEIYN